MYIYIHIPFCRTICNYCDFPKCLYHERYVAMYLTSLKKEIQTRYQNEEVKSIFIGGGTPTCLEYDAFQELLEITKLFQKANNFEFTIESNIESLDQRKIELMSEYQVNRVSLGVQSFQEDILKELNRHHNKQQVFEVIHNLKACGIVNISIDYMYGVHSDLNVIKKDLATFLQLDIPHISCYSLIIEQNTIFGINNRTYIDEELEYEMYQYIEKTLTKHHYLHYEISNYAKEGYASIHNLNYWNNGEYYGFGLGAVSYLNHNRITNTKSLTTYLKGNYSNDVMQETEEMQISNEFILGLRKIEGLDIRTFKKKYHKEIMEIDSVKKLLQEGKLVLENSHLKIPKKYFYLSNDILIHFV